MAVRTVVQAFRDRRWLKALRDGRLRKPLMVGAGVLSLVLLGLALVPELVRSRMITEAQRRGFVAEVERVEPRPTGVWLRNVRVRLPGEDFELLLDNVRVGLFDGSLRVTGGKLRGSGDPARLLDKVRGGQSSTQRASGGAERPILIAGLGVSWRRDGQHLTGGGLSAERQGSLLSISLEEGRFEETERVIQGPRLRAELRGLRAELRQEQGERKLSRLSLRSLDVFWEQAQSRPAPREQTTRPAVAGAAAPRSGRAARLRALRALLLPLASSRLADDAELVVLRASARVASGASSLSFGPSRFSMVRRADKLDIGLTPGGDSRSVTPLEFRAQLPLTPQKVQLTARGGPISLAALGIKTGQLGLEDVQRASLALDGKLDFSEDFETVDFGGRITARELSLKRPELSRELVGPLSVESTISARSRLDFTELEVTSGEANVAGLRAEFSGRFVSEPRQLRGRLRMPLAACQTFLEAVPQGLLTRVSGMRLAGSFGVDLKLEYDQSRIQDTRAALKVDNECRVESAPFELSPDRFARPFSREVKAADGSSVSIEGGPGTRSWVALDDISRHMETAILVCEDSRFHAHKGFDFSALQDALADDLKLGRFARGASTISMQLAKNLYLGTEKTLSRKLQEALLTLLLEERLTKREILELYMNVVELGPGLYGVGDAAQYYFATSARELSLGQALYLSSILPNPTQSHFQPSGELTPRWRAYLQRLMRIAHRIKRVSDEELELALNEPIAFRVPPDAARAGFTLPESEPDAELGSSAAESGALELSP
jgi:hypothetical protein